MFARGPPLPPVREGAAVAACMFRDQVGSEREESLSAVVTSAVNERDFKSPVPSHRPVECVRAGWCVGGVQGWGFGWAGCRVGGVQGGQGGQGGRRCRDGGFVASFMRRLVH